MITDNVYLDRNGFIAAGVGMKMNLENRVRNIDLSRSDVLLPLFDTIINSIEAIEDANIDRRDGRIKITITRDEKQQQLESGSRATLKVSSFSINDNGIGFTEENFKSFNTADSIHKYHRGGKGIGRFLWLKAFNKVHVESIYEEDGRMYKREFDFLLEEEEIECKKEIINETERSTTVHLEKLRKGFPCNKKVRTIATAIIEHFLFYFLMDDCPRITIRDAGEEELILNDIFSDFLVEDVYKEEIEIKGHHFELNHIKVNSGTEHEVHYCAKGRDVEIEKIEKKINNLTKKLENEDGKSYYYKVYVFGKYLDEHVNSTRTKFTMPRAGTIEGSTGDLTFDELHDKVIKIIRKRLSRELEKAAQESIEHCIEYTRTEDGQEYRSIVKHYPELLRDIPPNITGAELEVELHQIKTKLEKQMKDEVKSIRLEKPRTAQDLEVYKEKIDATLEKVGAIGQAELSKYVAHRNVIIDIFENNLELTTEDGYHYEEAIHKIIFPLNRTSDDISPEQQNLWLIDERLTHHFYLASDKRIKQCEPLESESEKKPDIIIFNHPFAFADTQHPFGSIVIIEFKRPFKENYTHGDNPYQQVYEYIEEIRAGKARTNKGRPIDVGKNQPFYAYIVVDIRPKLIEILKRVGFKETPDGLGLYHYQDPINTYFEVLSYKKIVIDAQKRNRILFEKLGLSTN